MNDNLFSILKSNFPDDLTTTFLQTGSGRSVSYADMLARSAQYANTLRALGLGPGERIAVQVGKSTEALMTYLGAIRVGAAFLPLNTAYTPAEVSYFLGDAEPRVVVCDPSKEDDIGAVAGKAKVETLGQDGASGSLPERVNAAPTAFEEVRCEADDLAAILYTSGTTGRAKGAMLTHKNLSSNAEALAAKWQFTAEDRLLHALPIYHTHGLFTASNTILHAGASMIFLPRFDADEVVSLLPQATAMMGVPTFYSRLLANDALTRNLVKHIRVFISGSAPLSPDIHREFELRTGHAILERYGMTETGMITSNPFDGARRAGTVGFALPGVEIRITEHESGKELAQGEVGDIEVRGPNVFNGYWQMPEKTAEEFRDDGFFVTGDLGMIDDQGYLNIVGRDKDLIISGGFNVYPAEIEAAIDELPAVAESAVIGVPHPDFGEGVMAVVACKAGETLEEGDVIASLSDTLARFKQPKRVAFVDALPRNAMGKVQKNELRDRYAETFQRPAK
ncbi:MAG: malonyl-CoA synthase [Hyphomicrobiaceae bacterium]|nr:malonyl-CoA synthase [Hyphomicrobiaceae bacterium]